MEKQRNDVPEQLQGLYARFFDGTPISAEVVDTSRGEADFRNAFLITAAAGEKTVLKLASNDFTFPEKVRMWQRTVEEYRGLGYYCPRIYADKTGAFPVIEYQGRPCVAWGEEFSRYRSLQDRAGSDGKGPLADSSPYLRDVWTMTARIAAKKLDYTEYPSAYCLFETFCPSDQTDEVLENALQWKKLAEALPEGFSGQVQRIWRLWSDNREALRPLYAQLPTSVLQADLNSTNLLIDEDGVFRGVYDFNLCGREVFLNYLMRENEPETIPEALRVARAHYAFSEEEKAAALPLFRCLKPLWYTSVYELKQAGDDPEKIGRCLDRAERELTEDYDFRADME
jgi:hypothetical protein